MARTNAPMAMTVNRPGAPCASPARIITLASAPGPAMSGMAGGKIVMSRRPRASAVSASVPRS